MIQSALNLLFEGKSLSREHAQGCIDSLLNGDATSEQVGAFLASLRMKQESAEEILGFLDCLRRHMIPIEVPPASANRVMDVCGTGGDRSGIFNVSTAVAFVVAAAGQPVAKHGNRAVSSRSGSFDVLEALGLRLEKDPNVITRSLERLGLGLIFAPAFHPALKAVAEYRKNLGVGTVFNVLGPLLNPMRVRRQLLGVHCPELLETVATVLKSQNDPRMEEALVVHSRDGLDEISLSAPTCMAHLKNGRVEMYEVCPEDFGLKRAPLSAILGGDAKVNADIMVRIFQGETVEAGPRRDIVVLNAAAALVVGGRASDFREGVAQAVNAIDSGCALELLSKMRGYEGGHDE